MIPLELDAKYIRIYGQICHRYSQGIYTWQRFHTNLLRLNKAWVGLLNKYKVR
jgi:hypothetical protein